MWIEVTNGLGFPEGPVALDDGSVLLCEIPKGEITRVLADGRKLLFARTGGGPNGMALGADGWLYVCNNGGITTREWQGLILVGAAPPGWRGGSIQRVGLATGRIETLYETGVSAQFGDVPLRAPNDIVLDGQGGFWFTDNGKSLGRQKDISGVFHALCDGSRCTEVVFPMDGPNGIGLSPDGRQLYVAETPSAALWQFEVSGPGALRLKPGVRWMTGECIARGGVNRGFDSLKVEAGGNICVATLGIGGISVFSPRGDLVEFHPTDDPFTTNIAFGGADLRDAWVTLAGSGRLVKARWPRPGLALAHQ